jgi:hypothetical protein
MASDGPIKKKDPELARVFQMLHESDTDVTRVVLVANSDPGKAPADRGDGIGLRHQRDARDLWSRASLFFREGRMLTTIREDIWAVRRNDPAAHGWAEILLCHVPLHAVLLHRLDNFEHFFIRQSRDKIDAGFL